MNHHQNVIQFNDIRKTFIQINLYFWEKKYLMMYVIESILRKHFKYFHLDKYQ